MINYNKKQNKIQAEKHNRLVNNLFSQQIADSIKQTKIYNNSNINHKIANSVDSSSQVWAMDTYSATIKAFKKYKHQKIAVLNFADFVNPGGGYLNGMMAQEEAICGQSDLYPIIVSQKEYYEYNKKHMNRGLYLNRALYTPNILWGISTRPQAKTDVITCAAPRKSRSKYIKNANDKMKYEHEANTAMQKRMNFVKQIAETEQVDVLILGAWGAGAFGFDAKSVAQMWQKAFEKPTSIKNIIYAIIDDKRSKAALSAFKNTFKK